MQRFSLCHSKLARKKWRAAGATSKPGSNSGGVLDMELHVKSRSKATSTSYCIAFLSSDEQESQCLAVFFISDEQLDENPLEYYRCAS
jgi:hypothetical protein